MSWQLEPTSQTYQWVDDGQGDPSKQPTYTPGEAYAGAATQSQLGTAAHSGAGGAQAVQTQNPQQRSNEALKRRLDPNSPTYIGPGYQLGQDAQGRATLSLVDPTANQVWKAQQQTRQPTPVGQGVIDPATGRPLGQQAPAPAGPQTAQQRVAAAGPLANQPAATPGFKPMQTAATATPGQQRVGQEIAAGTTGTGQPGGALGSQGFVQQDYTRYDAAKQGLEQARNDFYNELNRLSGVDPFGNQAFLQKATDRAVAQASGSAAMARGGAAAMAGAQRQAAGVQAQTAARGAQEVAEAGRRDAIQASQLRTQIVGGIGDVSNQLAANEVQFADQALKAAQVNLQAYLGGRELDQAEANSLRQLAIEVAQIDMERYKTDMNYRAQVDQNLTARYQSDQALRGVMAQVEASENLSGGELVMGVLGMGAGLGSAAIETLGSAPAAPAAAAVATSDRRAKFNVHDPDARDLADFLGNTKGKLYHYKEPNKPGRKPGLNFGPMAQDLAKSRIGATVVVKQKDGTLGVDAARLALADHAALAELAREVEKLKRRGGAKGGSK